MKEKDLEAWCRKKVIAAGGHMLKWVSPGTRGVPDRIVLLPGGYVAFVEFKTPNGRMSSLQDVWQRRLSSLGFRAYVIDDKKTFEALVLTRTDPSPPRAARSPSPPAS